MMKMRLEMPFNMLVNNNSRLVSSPISSLHKVLLCQPSQRSEAFTKNKSPDFCFYLAV